MNGIHLLTSHMADSVTRFTTLEKVGSFFEGFEGNAGGINAAVKLQQCDQIITQSSICSSGFCRLTHLVRQWPEIALCHAI